MRRDRRTAAADRSRPPAGRAGSTPHPPSRDRPGGPAHLPADAPAERPVPVGVAAGAARRVPLPAAVRPVAAPAAVRRPAGVAEPRGARRAPRARARSGSCRTRSGYIQEIIDELAAFTRENWLPGGAQRFGNTKTFGVLRGEFTVLPGLPEHLRHGLFAAAAAAYPAWVRFSGPGPYAPPDLEDFGQCSVGIKVMGVPGPKLMEDEQRHPGPDPGLAGQLRDARTSGRTRSCSAGCARRRRWATRSTPATRTCCTWSMQLLYSPMHANPLEVQYYSNVPVPARRRPGGAVLAASRLAEGRTPDPGASPAENYLRDAMVAHPRRGRLGVRLHGAGADRPAPDADRGRHREVARAAVAVRPGGAAAAAARSGSTPTRSSRSPTSLRYNPWHSLPEHRPLGNSNRARRAMYCELAKLRQRMNAVAARRADRRGDVPGWDVPGCTGLGAGPMSELASESVSQRFREAPTERSEGVR